MAKLKSVAELEAFRKTIIGRKDPKKTVITVCNGTGCQAFGSKNILAAFQKEGGCESDLCCERICL